MPFPKDAVVSRYTTTSMHDSGKKRKVDAAYHKKVCRVSFKFDSLVQLDLSGLNTLVHPRLMY